MHLKFNKNRISEFVRIFVSTLENTKKRQIYNLFSTIICYLA